MMVPRPFASRGVGGEDCAVCWSTGCDVRCLIYLTRVRRPLGTDVARAVAGERVRDVFADMDARGDAAETLAESGAVGIPIELIVTGVSERARHVLLLVTDHIGLGAVHVLVGAEGDFDEIAAVRRLEIHAATRTVGDRIDAGVQRNAVVVIRDGTHDAAVLIGLREHGDQGFDRAQRGVLVGVPAQIVIGVIGAEVEVIDITGGSNRSRRRPEGKRCSNGEKRGELQETSHPTEPNEPGVYLLRPTQKMRRNGNTTPCGS